MPHMDVIWDEELLQSSNTHDDLLQQVSWSGECLVAKARKSSVELNINGKLADVNSPSFILDLGMDVVHEDFDELHLADNFETMAEHVEFMDQVTYVGDEQELFARIHIEGSTTALADEVIWDQELLHSPESHGLLLQLANDDELLHVRQKAGFDECLVADKKAIIDLVINDLISHDSAMDTADKLFNDMPLEVRWDEERQSDIGTHGSLLQHLSLSVDDEKTKHTIKLNDSVVLTPVSTSCLLNQCMNAADQVFDDFPSKVVVWDVELFHDLDSHDGFLQQLAGSIESIDGNKAKGVIEVDTDKVLSHYMGGLSHFLEICETSNTDEAGKLVAEILMRAVRYNI